MARQQSMEFWARHVAAMETSGLTRAAYCRRHGLNYGTLYGWWRRLRQGDATVSPVGQTGQALVPVMVATPPHPTPALLEIRVGAQVVVSVPTSVDAVWLGALLRAVSGC